MLMSSSIYESRHSQEEYLSGSGSVSEIVVGIPGSERPLGLQEFMTITSFSGTCLFSAEGTSPVDSFVVGVARLNSQVHRRHPGESDVEIYSFCSDAWKEIQVQYFPWIVRDEASSVMCNDNLHWIPHNCDRDDPVVLSFNIEKYGLDEVKLPDLTVHTDSPLTVTAVVLKECLCLFGHVLPVGSGEESTRCYLWIMKDYGVAESWTMLYEIDCQLKIRSLILLDQKNEILKIQSPGREHIREVISSEDKDSDDLEQFSEDYSYDDEASEEDYYEISDGEVSEGSDKELSEGSDKGVFRFSTALSKREIKVMREVKRINSCPKDLLITVLIV
ncbi:hypothetical protein ACET3Z_030863 [Daucus carota]